MKQPLTPEEFEFRTLCHDPAFLAGIHDVHYSGYRIETLNKIVYSFDRDDFSELLNKLDALSRIIKLDKYFRHDNHSCYSFLDGANNKISCKIFDDRICFGDVLRNRDKDGY